MNNLQFDQTNYEVNDLSLSTPSKKHKHTGYEKRRVIGMPSMFTEEKHVNRLFQMMVNSQTKQLYNSDDIVKMHLKNKTFSDYCSIRQSPGDGHCLLHSIIASMKSQLRPSVDVNVDYILRCVYDEISKNSDKYTPFLENQDCQALMKGFCNYAYHKIYNTEFCDIVPTIICNIMQLNIIVIEELGSAYIVRNVGHDVSHTPLYLHKTGDHYNAIVHCHESINNS